jgi:hypothetical protein
MLLALVTLAAILAPQPFSSFAHTALVTHCDVYVHSTAAAQTPGEMLRMTADAPLLEALNATSLRFDGTYRTISWGEGQHLYHDGGQGAWCEDASLTLDEHGSVYGHDGRRYRLTGDANGVTAQLRALAK